MLKQQHAFSCLRQMVFFRPVLFLDSTPFSCCPARHALCSRHAPFPANLSTSDSVLLSLTSGCLRRPHWQDQYPLSFWVHCCIALAILHHVPYLCVCLPQATALSFILALYPHLSTGPYDGQSVPGHYVDIDGAF